MTDASVTIDRNSKISLALVIVVLSAVIGVVIFITKANASIESHVENPAIHESILQTLKAEYTPTGELNQRLENIEEKLVEIKGLLKNL